MSGRDLYRQPTWTGLGPPRLRPRPVPIELAHRIAAAIGTTMGSRGRLSALRPVAAGTGLFRFAREDGARFFVKLVPDTRRDSLIAADDIARWLHDRGIVVPLPFPGYPLEVEGGSSIFAYPEINGTKPPPSQASLGLLGREIATVHRALREHPRRRDWERATRTRMTHLAEIRVALAERAKCAGPRPDALAAIAARRDLEFDGDRGDAVPLHGDLNPGNLLRRRGDGRIVFLDFEDVGHSVLPVAFELALVAERMVMVRDFEDRQATALIAALYRGYEDGAGEGPQVAPREAPQRLQALALRSLCILADAQWNGIPMPQREWAKFFTLYDLAERRHRVFDAAA